MLLFTFGKLSAQALQVEVRSVKDDALPATLEVLAGDSRQIIETDSLGKALIHVNQSGRRIKIRVHAPGFQSDSLLAELDQPLLFRLQPIQQLPEVEVEAKAQAAFFDKKAVVKTEVINRQELKKAACCDLAGCFETQGTVHPQVSNVLSNAKELRILGLSGVYNQLLVDGMPTLLGMSFPFGVSGIPGPLVENIYIAKGTNSVLQGFESISGQINVITSEPDKADKLKTSFYLNQFGEAHLNAAFAHKEEKHALVAGIHAVQPANRRDRDGDGFLDVTRLQRRMAFLNGRWTGTELSGEYGVRASVESRSSGQYNYQAGRDEGSTVLYGQSIDFYQLDARKKLEYRFRENQRIIFQAAGQFHLQNSWYGALQYKGVQGLAYGNLQHELIWKGHILRSGFSQRWLDAQEQIGLASDPAARTFDGSYRKQEFIPGLFAENSFSFRDDRLKIITGLRADHHNQFGWQLVPRIMLRLDLQANSILRMNAGRGWRTLNLFTDHGQILAGNRNLEISPGLRPESAWNTGLSFTQNFESSRSSGYLSTDFYYTSFDNQLFPDYDASGQRIVFRNFTGRSQSLYAQLEGKLNLEPGFSLRCSYSWTENHRFVSGEKVILPFTPLHRGLIAISWRPGNGNWQLDINQHIYGTQYLPDTRQNPEAYRTPQRSPAYQLLNCQIIRFQKSFELYAGCENLLDFRQRRPITAWQEPFSPWFDTAGVWGPTRGREFYAGFRFRLK